MILKFKQPLFCTALLSFWLYALCGAFAMVAGGISGCTTVPENASQTQQFESVRLDTLTLLDRVTLAATAAINSDVLKGTAADTTIATIKAGRLGIAAAEVTARTDSPLATRQIAIITASLTAVDSMLIYINTPKVKP